MKQKDKNMKNKLMIFKVKSIKFKNKSNKWQQRYHQSIDL